MLAAQGLTYSEEIENQLNWASAESGSTATTTTLTSRAVGMVLYISEFPLTEMEAAVELDQYNTNPAGYAVVV